MLTLAQNYNKSILDEMTLTAEQKEIRHVGKQDPNRHLEEQVESAISENILRALGTMVFFCFPRIDVWN